MAQVFLTLHLYLQTGYACMHAQSPQLCLTLWTVAHQAPVSMGFSRQEYWSGLPFPSSGNEHTSLASPALGGRFFTTSTTCCCCCLSRFSRVRLFETPWTVALQVPVSMGFSRQEYWSGLPCPPPGDLPDPGTELESPAALHCRQILYS